MITTLLKLIFYMMLWAIGLAGVCVMLGVLLAGLNSLSQL